MSIAYSQHFLKIFKKRLKGNKSHLELFLSEVELFKIDPFHPSLNTHKLTGTLQGYWSFSIDDDLRVVFYFSTKNKVVFADIGTHDEVY
ncbi:MAG: type II toxin-antitoxin system YafQ family toxin [Bacteroidetes bacterium]|nr:type II toxin-antitoxin system YafQ family toxin [Bacteroidota bacterium]MBS1540854.1 type II toxin-antitoxin system YafQ family toxin [Bacteroidota bacterium]